jgi:hypothetical protein
MTAARLLRCLSRVLAHRYVAQIKLLRPQLGRS